MSTRNDTGPEAQFLAGAGGAHRAVLGRRRRPDAAHAQCRSGRGARRATVARGAAHAVRGAKRAARRSERLRCARQERGAPQEPARRPAGQGRAAPATAGGTLEQVERRRAHGRRGPSRPWRPFKHRIRKCANWRPSCCRSSAIWRSAVGVQKLEGMSRYLERFELTVQRIQQDLNGLRIGRERCRPRPRSAWPTAWNS